MSNKFTQKAQSALQRAMSMAREMGHTYIGSEHLLLGLLTEEHSISARLLTAKGADPERLKKTMIEISGLGAPSFVSPSDMTPRARKIIENAAGESLRSGARYIGTEHLLLALLEERDSVGVRLLEADGILASDLKKDVSLYLGSAIEQEKRPYEKSASEEKLRIRGAPTLSTYGRDLTEQARLGRVDPVIGRERETERVIRILSRRTKNNPCLLGEPGVGKTAVVEGLAMRIAEGSVPESLRNRRIVTLDISSMIAGAKYRGEFEERMKKVMDEAAKNPDLILFIDELHVIIGAGAAEGAVDAANIIKPALARSELQMIGATTLSEYRAHIERDAALERRFQSVILEEPSAEQSIRILHGLREKYEEHHKIKISDEAIDAAVRLSIRYIPDRFLPDKAIDLIDEAASAVRISAFSPEAPLHSLEEELAALRNQKEDAVLRQAFEEAATVRDREQSILQKMQELQKEEMPDKGTLSLPNVKASDVADVVTAWTGIPLHRLLEDESRKLLRLEEALSRAVIGQENATRELATAIRRGRTGLGDPRRPIGSFIFLGQTGVGKTELAKALAVELFGSDRAMIRLDMSEYMEKHSVSRLIGAPPGYVGYEEGGQLTEKVRRRPYAVVLFDEIEKAHSDVFHLLLQVLEDGVLSDSQGRTVDFSNTVIIMTSNLGTNDRETHKILGFSDGLAGAWKKQEEAMLSALKERFRPEFLNRIDEIILFRPLSKEDLAKIAEQLLSEVQNRAAELGVTLSFSADVSRLLSEQTYRQEYGARPLRRAVIRRIEDPLSTKLLEGSVKKGDSLLVAVSDGEIDFQKETAALSN